MMRYQYRNRYNRNQFERQASRVMFNLIDNLQAVVDRIYIVSRALDFADIKTLINARDQIQRIEHDIRNLRVELTNRIIKQSSEPTINHNGPPAQ